MIHALRTHRETVGADQRSATQPDTQHVGHTEVGAHPAHLDGHAGLAREAVLEGAHVGGRAADVDDQRFLQAGEERRAAHGVGRSRGEGEHGEPLRVLGRH